jgi:hypothetical protein
MSAESYSVVPILRNIAAVFFAAVAGGALGSLLPDPSFIIGHDPPGFGGAIGGGAIMIAYLFARRPRPNHTTTKPL